MRCAWGLVAAFSRHDIGVSLHCGSVCGSLMVGKDNSFVLPRIPRGGFLGHHRPSGAKRADPTGEIAGAARGGS